MLFYFNPLPSGIQQNKFNQKIVSRNDYNLFMLKF